MTFEEFFLKKKIDLELLQANKPELFAEFKSHYEQMSEKSFDHTKKYWFNNLRQEFRLSDDKESKLKEAFKPKDIIPPAAITEEIKAVPEKELNSAKTERPSIEIIGEAVAEAKPAGFKPRFKAGVKKPVEDVEKTLLVKEEDNPLLQEDKPSFVKPSGFKPRFKPGITKPAENTAQKETELVQQSEEKTLEEDKPKTVNSVGFKPRFKAGVTKPVEKIDEKVKEPVPQLEEKILEEDKLKTIKPAGFKPRFKAGQTSVKKDEEK
jgi:hypothetical protein